MNEATNYAELYYSKSQNDIDFLKKTADDFPASSVARFLLLYHYKKNNLPGFEELAKQTGIYLTNPLWIQFQLSQIEKSEDNSAELLPEEQITEEKISLTDAEKEIANRAENEEEPAVPATVNEEITESSSWKIEQVDEENKEDSLPEIKEEDAVPATVNEEITESPSLEIEQVDEENKEDSLPEIKEEDAVPATVNEQITESPSLEIEQVDEENKEDSLAEIKEEDAVPATVNEEITEFPSLEIEQVDEESKEDSLAEIKEEDLTEDVENVSTENIEVSKEENPVEEKSVFDIKIPDEEINSSEAVPDSGLKYEEDDEESVIAFEPLHTVDYFASQGIKINEEALANDHLGKQVKSFTAWLKSMKKLHPGQLPEQNEVIERIIQSSSEASNKETDVLTEAMAEVLVKQGKREKAIEMYEKLSLLNPSKSAYFAAKIESLKLI